MPQTVQLVSDNLSTAMGTPANPLAASPYAAIPAAATAVVAVSGDVAASAATVSLPSVVGKTNYVSGFSVSGMGATSALVLNLGLTNLIGNQTMTWDYAVPAGVAVAAPTITVNFSPPIPANGTNLAIQLIVPSFGTGNLHASANIWGFYV